MLERSPARRPKRPGPPRPTAILTRVAGTYQGLIEYAELAAEVQEASGIHTRRQVRSWLGPVPGARRPAEPRERRAAADLPGRAEGRRHRRGRVRRGGAPRRRARLRGPAGAREARGQGPAGLLPVGRRQDARPTAVARPSRRASTRSTPGCARSAAPPSSRPSARTATWRSRRPASATTAAELRPGRRASTRAAPAAAPHLFRRELRALALVTGDDGPGGGHPGQPRDPEHSPQLHRRTSSRTTPHADSRLDLDAAVDLTRTGDLWLFRGRSAADHAIRVLTNAPVNHVGMAVVLDDMPPLMWHAELGKGLPCVWSGGATAASSCTTCATRWMQWTGRYGQRAWLRQLDAAGHPGDGGRRAATIARLDGTPFPATAALAGRWARGRVRRAAPAESTYCAEVVAATYAAMGLLDDRRPTNYYDPGDVLVRRRPAPRAGRPARRGDRGRRVTRDAESPDGAGRSLCPRHPPRPTGCSVTAPTVGPTTASRSWCCASASASFSLLQSMVTPVLATIEAALGTDQATVTWVLTAYLLSASVFTPIVGRVGDKVGKERMLVFALARWRSARCSRRSPRPSAC